MKTLLLTLCACLVAAGFALAQAGRIYTQPSPSDTGAIAGKTSGELTHVVAVEHDRERVYLGTLSDGGRAFRFERLPVGKYDLVLFPKNGPIAEGLALGASATLPEASAKHLADRVKAADSFFNQATVHRMGLSEEGDTVLALVERYRANNVLKQSGDTLGQLVRRFEVIEFTRADDDWQLTTTRHLYREGEPIPERPDFRKTVQLPALGGVRVITNLKDLGEIALPQ
ncbi:MAG: hypothetical protein ACFUZC_01575 [Chthoniobacteraceae bacterium]